jgi:Protein of unknown function (DUF664)
MPSLPGTFAEDVINQPARGQFEAFLDEHRGELNRCLDGLTEEQARQSLVPSQTTLLGLVKHATFLEKVWFDEAVTGRSRAEIGIPAASGESFVLHEDDTIASVRQAHREACESSRRATSPLGLDDRVYGYWRGPLPLRWVYLRVLMPRTGRVEAEVTTRDKNFFTPTRASIVLFLTFSYLTGRAAVCQGWTLFIGAKAGRPYLLGAKLASRCSVRRGAR